MGWEQELKARIGELERDRAELLALIADLQADNAEQVECIRGLVEILETEATERGKAAARKQWAATKRNPDRLAAERFLRAYKAGRHPEIVGDRACAEEVLKRWPRQWQLETIVTNLRRHKYDPK